MKKYVIIIAVIIGLSSSIAALWWQSKPPIKTVSTSSKYSQSAFDKWHGKDISRQKRYGEFKQFLANEGLDKTVPIWQLTRTDSGIKPKCKRPPFIIPPEELWQNIAPALRLIQKEIIPAVGSLEVYSSYRTLKFNDCVGGATKSQHLRFGGLDLVATDINDNKELFSILCSLHKRIGPKENMGLGAYFDPSKPKQNSIARFHIDAEGYRSWGFSKKAASSGCKLLQSS